MMKYVRLDYAGLVIFDKSQKHSDVANKFPNDRVISAGFINMDVTSAHVNCYGESQTLHKSSREQEDADMFNRRFSI